jgi:hypothetical protein
MRNKIKFVALETYTLDMEDDGFVRFEKGREYETHNPMIFFWASAGRVRLLNRRHPSRVWKE